jgi:hypothetical protein
VDDLEPAADPDAAAAAVVGFEVALPEDDVPDLDFELEDRESFFSLSFSFPFTLGLVCPLVLEEDPPF